MRAKGILASLGLFASFAPVGAQFPPPAHFPGPMQLPPTMPLPGSRGPAPYQPASPPISIPRLPEPPRMPLPPATPQPPASLAPPTGLPDGTVRPTPRVEMPLPQPEEKIAIDSTAVSMKLINGSWQVWAGQRAIKNLGKDDAGAKDVVRVMHDLHPTEWVAIGSPRPVVEYGLTDGRPAIPVGFPRMSVPIDLRTARVEPVKGVWCLRDDGNILFNFGLNRADADQALAVVRRYGFNRVGMVGGEPTTPALTYFYVALEADGAKPPKPNAFANAIQEQGLARTGIPVAGVGYIGEMVKIDSRKIDVRRDGANWVVASGAEVLAKFGQDQSAARDAQRLIQEGQFTDFCRAGPPGLTFFLANGQAPTRVPLYVHGRRYEPSTLKVSQLGERWSVTERGRHLFDVSGPEEGDAVVKLLKQYQFDQLCQIGSSPRTSLTFLAKAR